MNCYRMIEAYVIKRDEPGGPAAYIGRLAPWDHVFKDTLYATQEMLGDAAAVRHSFSIFSRLPLLMHLVQIYRTYVVWGRNWKAIALPCALLTVSLSTSDAHYYLYASLTGYDSLWLLCLWSIPY